MDQAGGGPVERRDPSALRISDDDRHQVAEVLRQAAGEGRIDLDELDERLAATYQAKTYGDLVPITADLPTQQATQATRQPPGPRPWPAHPMPAGPVHETSMAIMSETRRTGSWTVPGTHNAFTLMGAVTLDLREAHFETREVLINASAIMGEVKVLVNAGTTVVVDGVGVMGEFSEQRAKVPFDPGAGGPTVRLRGFALMGGVHVQRKGPPAASVRNRLGWSR